MTEFGKLLWNGHENLKIYQDPVRMGILKVTNGDDSIYGGDLTYDQVVELVNVLQEWLRDAYPEEEPQIEDDTMNAKMEDSMGGNPYMPYVQRLNDAMNKMQEGLKEIGEVTREMDENKMFGGFRETLAVSEQNFVTGFILYKKLMVDAVAALAETKNE